jgi:hypothetical protein
VVPPNDGMKLPTPRVARQRSVVAAASCSPFGEQPAPQLILRVRPTLAPADYSRCPRCRQCCAAGIPGVHVVRSPDGCSGFERRPFGVKAVLRDLEGGIPSARNAGMTRLVARPLHGRAQDRTQEAHRSFAAVLGGLATAAVTLTCSSPAGPTSYCHSINATTMNGTTGATESITCPTGATQFCDVVPILATNSSQAEAAGNVCFGRGCSNSLPCGGGGAGWFGLHDVANPPVPNACFTYIGGIAGDFGCSTPGARFTAGSIVAGAGDKTGCPTIPPSRWAP